jgi:protein subunit release factor B
VAAGAVVVESGDGVQAVWFLDRLDVPRISGGGEALDLAYEMARSQVTDATDRSVSMSTRPVSLTIGSQGSGHQSFEVRVAGGDVRRWAADRLGITRWVRIGPTVEIGA